MKTYQVTIELIVEAKNEDEAREVALQSACYDDDIEVREIGDDGEDDD